MNFEIRRAGREDVSALAGIEAAQPFAAGWGEKGLLAELDKRESLLLAAFGPDGAAGFCCAAVLPPEMQILNIAVSPARARAGIASALIAAARSRAVQAGCALVTLEVSAANSAAIALYGKLGFSVVGRRPKFYNGCCDALLMNLEIMP
ncbi:MAG: GNAT family N-acetyltransferase [Elusimicrobiales bacterium]